MGKRADIKIYGTDYPTPDGTCIRDYIHIDDLCRAHLLALKKLDERAELAYNLGNGQGYSVRQVIDTVKRVSGRDFKVVEVQRRPGDPPVLTSDATKAKNELRLAAGETRVGGDGRHRLEMAHANTRTGIWIDDLRIMIYDSELMVGMQRDRLTVRSRVRTWPGEAES